jgi:hypothetical protein
MINITFLSNVFYLNHFENYNENLNSISRINKNYCQHGFSLADFQLAKEIVQYSADTFPALAKQVVVNHSWFSASITHVRDGKNRHLR